MCKNQKKKKKNFVSYTIFYWENDISLEDVYFHVFKQEEVRIGNSRSETCSFCQRAKKFLRMSEDRDEKDKEAI